MGGKEQKGEMDIKENQKARPKKIPVDSRNGHPTRTTASKEPSTRGTQRVENAGKISAVLRRLGTLSTGSRGRIK